MHSSRTSSPARARLRQVVLTVGGAVLAAVAVLAVEVAVLLGREYPGQEVGYEVDATVRPRGPVRSEEVVEFVIPGDSTVAGWAVLRETRPCGG